MTALQFVVQNLDLAEKQLQSGEYITQEDLEKESENW